MDLERLERLPFTLRKSPEITIHGRAEKSCISPWCSDADHKWAWDWRGRWEWWGGCARAFPTRLYVDVSANL